MKKSILLVIIISTLNIFAQEINNKPFSTFKFGAFAGINFYKTSDIGGEVLVEGKSNLFKNVGLKVGVGYYKVFQPVDYSVKYNYSITASSPHPDIEYLTLYYAESSTYSKHIYDVFPLSLGFQYSVSIKSITPYLTLDGSYNLISPLFERSVVTWEYENSEDIPEEFRNKGPRLPTSSLGVSLGGGVKFALSEAIDIDLRYYYKTDNEIVNTHHILVGLVL